MSSVNKAIILGHLGKDPEVRYMPNGTAVANVTIATSRSWKDKTSGERQEETEWHRVVFYDRLAEIAGEYLKKGKAVYIEGRLRTRKWTDKDGVEKYTTEIVALEMQMLGGGRDSEGGGDNGGHGNTTRTRPQQQQPQGRPAAAPASKGGGGGTAFDDMDDDIPFTTDAMNHEFVSRLDRRMRKYR